MSSTLQRTWLGAVGLLLVMAAFTAQATDVPYLTGRIVDNAEILSPGARESLDAKLAAHEQATTNQVVILTVASLDGESIEGFATRVFDAWQLGQAGKDNGVLVIVAPNDRRMRIEVGYGLEGTFTDLQASRIIRDQMTPPFRDSRYDDGITAGVDAIVATLEGRAAEEAPPAPAATGPSRSFFADEELDAFEGDLPPWPMRILLGAFIFGIIGLFTVIGVLTPGAGWFLYLFLIPFWAMFPIVVVGVRGALVLFCAYLIGFPVAKLIVSRQGWHRKAKAELSKTGSATIGGMVITSGGGRGGSWSSGSSRSSGGFSGGGGRSGGGGASGGW
jgi:uncharacterized protein